MTLVTATLEEGENWNSSMANDLDNAQHTQQVQDKDIWLTGS